MKLSHVPGYAIRQVTTPTPDKAPTSEIVITGIPSGTIVDGAVLEAALKWNDYVLLFLSDDCPFEETLNIYLLDTNLQVADLARMYHIYTAAAFSDLDLSLPDTVRFRFFGETVWTLTLFADKKFMLPIVSAPTGVHRPFSFFHRFQLAPQPLPASATLERPGDS
ncbi:hypothetical protein ACLB1G_19965 [Oxalobacteraceae bacterium A2-2]